MIRQNIKFLFIILAFILAFLGGVWLTRYYYGWTEEKVQEQSTVLLEKVKTVTKLINVEGHFSEVFDHKTYWMYDVSFFQKKALIRVQAKVSVGFDLEKMKIEADNARKVVKISNLPKAEILSIDHNIDYYDISEGVFNSFSPQDYTRLNQKAKTMIEQKAKESDLFRKAEAQGNQMLEVIEFMVTSAGWKVEYTDSIPTENKDTLKR